MQPRQSRHQPPAAPLLACVRAVAAAAERGQPPRPPLGRCGRPGWPAGPRRRWFGRSRREGTGSIAGMRLGRERSGRRAAGSGFGMLRVRSSGGAPGFDQQLAACRAGDGARLAGSVIASVGARSRARQGACVGAESVSCAVGWRCACRASDRCAWSGLPGGLGAFSIPGVCVASVFLIEWLGTAPGGELRQARPKGMAVRAAKLARRELGVAVRRDARHRGHDTPALAAPSLPERRFEATRVTVAMRLRRDGSRLRSAWTRLGRACRAPECRS